MKIKSTRPSKGCRTCYGTGYHFVPIGDGRHFVRVKHWCQQQPRIIREPKVTILGTITGRLPR